MAEENGSNGERIEIRLSDLLKVAAVQLMRQIISLCQDWANIRKAIDSRFLMFSGLPAELSASILSDVHVNDEVSKKIIEGMIIIMAVASEGLSKNSKLVDDQIKGCPNSIEDMKAIIDELETNGSVTPARMRSLQRIMKELEAVNDLCNDYMNSFINSFSAFLVSMVASIDAFIENHQQNNLGCDVINRLRRKRDELIINLTEVNMLKR
mmetsp:Transcript_1957/g.2518  ORF Transcript_1957/g.2518 Transcript_1957/m.2518 type:complete len:210 (-) Transcript_1957:135-764(-)|eukprot:CAMPEP_0204823930 /NCGR_PEP_ID=MMETSP1346-20131115/2006_1 /ASSEMBLY_ACC=CAM_ASM_000771 /TAXON_ID=215587 /ORGANISM="Aplanochytrium stocchinoi, Strain GSBS06" /LENGTH=209 /DNA_ID=CAMNT_0051950823 /DNA_START=634 /DNA_END=1263 /DNA_ORIENTATION=+